MSSGHLCAVGTKAPTELASENAGVRWTPLRHRRKSADRADRREQVLLPLPSRDNKKDIVPENPDFIGVFAVLGGDFLRISFIDVKRQISLCGMI